MKPMTLRQRVKYEGATGALWSLVSDLDTAHAAVVGTPYYDAGIWISGIQRTLGIVLVELAQQLDMVFTAEAYEDAK